MQRTIKNKITFFTFGLLAGVTIGVVFGVAIKALFGHLNDLHIGIVKIGSKEEQISQRLDSIEGKMADNKKKTVVVSVVKPVVKKVIHSVGADSTGKTGAVKDSAQKPVADGEDSIPLDNSQEDTAGDVIVMTNQLVSVARVKLMNMDSAGSKQSKAARESDSAIAALNGTNVVSAPSSYRIEFWESPLNFRGYKMSLGKIIVYGISSNAHLRLVKLDDVYYLLADQNAYRVDYTDDLKQFDRVTDKTILKKLSL